MTNKVDNEGNKTESERIITKIETDGSDSDCFQNLKRMRDFVIKKRQEQRGFVPAGRWSEEGNLHKMAEYVFCDCGINCYVFQTNTKRESYRRAKDTDAIMVSQEGKSYANLLKIVKEGMKAEGKDMTDSINTIRQT